MQQHQRPGQQDFGAAGIEPAQRLTLGERHATQSADEFRELRCCEQMAVELLERLARLFEVYQLGQRMDRP